MKYILLPLLFWHKTSSFAKKKKRRNKSDLTFAILAENSQPESIFHSVMHEVFLGFPYPADRRLKPLIVPQACQGTGTPSQCVNCVCMWSPPEPKSWSAHMCVLAQTHALTSVSQMESPTHSFSTAEPVLSCLITSLECHFKLVKIVSLAH